MCARRAAFICVAITALALLAACATVVARSLAVVRVAGESMHPALHAADVCLVWRGAPIRRGDVALYVAPGHTQAVLHRVVGRAADGYVTRGDANPVVDFDHLPASSVRGRLIAVLPVGVLLERWRGSGGGAKLHYQSQTAGR